MTPIKPKQDHTFSAFAVGVTVGAIAGLLFGTEEGRKIVKNALDLIPDKYKNFSIGKTQEPTRPDIPIIPQEETPHHTFATPSFESPPPPAPNVRPVRPFKS